MNIEETNALVEEVKTVFGDEYEVKASIGAKDTEYEYNYVAVSQIFPYACVFTMNQTGDWTAFQKAARVFVAKEQEKEQEKALEEQAGELGFGNDLEWKESQASQDFFQSPDWDGRVPGMPEEEEIDPFLDGPDLNETVHAVVETNPWSLTNPNGYWHD